jgi:hypothetical protein
MRMHAGYLVLRVKPILTAHRKLLFTCGDIATSSVEAKSSTARYAYFYPQSEKGAMLCGLHI